MEGKGGFASLLAKRKQQSMSEAIPHSWKPVLEPALATPQARQLGDGEWWRAGGYTLGSVTLGIAAVVLGGVLASSVLQTRS